MKFPVLMKTCTYGMLHMVVSFLVSWFVTKSLMMAMGISFLEPSIQIGAYFCHEKLWHLYGRRHPELAAPDWNISGSCPIHDHHGHSHGHGHDHHHHHHAHETAEAKKDGPKSS